MFRVIATDANGKVVCGGSGGGWQGTVSEAYSVFDFSEDGWGAVGGKACGPEDIAGNPFNYDGDSTLRSNEESRNMGLHKVCFLTAVNPGKDSPETGTCKVEKIGNNWYLKATDNKIVNTTSICGEIKEKGLEKTIERWAMLCEAVCLD